MSMNEYLVHFKRKRANLSTYAYSIEDLKEKLKNGPDKYEEIDYIEEITSTKYY